MGMMLIPRSLANYVMSKVRSHYEIVPRCNPLDDQIRNILIEKLLVYTVFLINHPFQLLLCIIIISYHLRILL